MDELYTKLLRNYNKNVRPVKSFFTTLDIHANMKLSQIIRLVSFYLLSSLLFWVHYPSSAVVPQTVRVHIFRTLDPSFKYHLCVYKFVDKKVQLQC